MVERRLFVVAAGLVVAGLLLAVGRGGSDGTAVATDETTVTTRRPAVATTVAGGGAVVGTADPAATATSSGSPAGPPAESEPVAIEVGGTAGTEGAAAPGDAPIAPPPLRAPAVGAYFERYEGPSGGGDGTLAITRRGDATTLRRRVEDRISSQTVRYDDAGVHLLASNDGGGPCRYAAPPVLQPAILDLGAAWSSDATCTTDDGVEVRRVEEAEVSGWARTTVDGFALDTWIIQRHIVETSTGDGVVAVSETASSELFAPGVGVAVYRLARNEAPDVDGEIVATAVAIELTSTTPS